MAFSSKNAYFIDVYSSVTLPGKVVLSITIENIPEDEAKEAVEQEYVPEKTTLKEKPVADKTVNMQDIGFFRDGKFVPVFHVDKNGRLNSIDNNKEKESTITEAKKEDEEDPNLGKKFVLKAGNRGFVTFDKNAIDFTNKPEDALHFTEGKEESGMVSMSKVTEILDAMGIFDVEKYFQTGNINLGTAPQEEPKDECGLTQKSIQAPVTQESAITEENGANTKYIAKISINSSNGSNQETIPVSATDLENAKNEISNLWEMKNKSIEGQGTVDVILIDTQTGEESHYNPQSQLFEGSEESSKEICDQCEGEFDKAEMQELQGGKYCKDCYQKITGDAPFAEEYNENDFKDPIICSWCKDMVEKEDCKKEKDLGYICDQCQRSLISQGVPLEFEDETDPRDVVEEDANVEVDGDKVTTKIDDDLTIEKQFDSPIQAQVATAAVAQGKADPKVLVPEANEVDEKLYSNPSEPSDELQKEPLEDATSEDFIVVLSNIDWDIDNVDPNFLNKIESLPDTIDVRIQDTMINTADSPEDLKAVILAGANERMYPFGIKDGTIVSLKDAKTGEILA